MNVYWIWSLECPQCQRFAQSGVVDLVENTLYGVQDVWWIQRRVDLTTSTENPTAPDPVLRMNGGRVEPLAVFTQSIRDLERKVGDNLQTPTMLLEHEGTVEDVNPIAQIGKGVFNDIESEAWSAVRSLVSKVFTFYLRNVIDVSRQDRRVMRQSGGPGAAKRMKPPYIYGEYQLHEWQDAFTRAREAQY